MATLTKRLSRAALAGLYPRCEGGVEGHRGQRGPRLQGGLVEILEPVEVVVIPDTVEPELIGLSPEADEDLVVEDGRDLR
jgi:hypothetical protein